MHDILIHGGTVVDGTGAPARLADVAVQGGRIVAVGTQLGAAHRVVDATGLLVTPGDAGEMAAAALELLQDLPRCRSFGDAAQQRARERFGLDRQVAAYATLFRRLASSEASG